MAFVDHLRKAKVDEETIQTVLRADDLEEPQEGTQAYATWVASVMERCDTLLPYDTVSGAMFDRACCKTGFRLKNVQQFAKEHAKKPLGDKLLLLGELRYMGKPFLNADGDIETVAVGSHQVSGMLCPCWRLKGTTPANGPMPLSYCMCCGGHFRFHYQKALGLKLRLKKVSSSIIHSCGEKPCVFLYEVLDK